LVIHKDFGFVNAKMPQKLNCKSWTFLPDNQEKFRYYGLYIVKCIIPACMFICSLEFFVWNQLQLKFNNICYHRH